MYIPKHFAEPRTEVLHQLMRACPLASLVTLTAGGIDANHLPLLLCAEDGPLGTLRGHVARTNPIGRDLVGDVEALAIFHGPDAYVTPSWYASKAETGKVVPTWNYAVAHAHGALRLVDDAQWIRAQMVALTRQSEAASALPWRVDDAPADYVDALIGAVIGVEMVITRLTGKWKLSQNQNAPNRAGVVGGLRARGDTDAVRMAELIEQAGHAR